MDHNPQEVPIDPFAPESEVTAAPAAEPAAEALPNTAALQARITELEAQLQDEKLRAAANEQNLRRRHQDELLGAHKFAGQKFATEMLPVKDYLEMALADQSGQFEALKMGVQMTLNELNKAFDNTRISEINPQPGEMLDPHRHQALQTEESTLPANSIVRVMKKGYALVDRVLRPAMVVVATAANDQPTEGNHS